MFKRRFPKKNSALLLQCSSRASDISKPNNTSLIVNDSDTESDELPKEITSVLSEVDCLIENRHSSSLIKSLSQRTQSTPLRSKAENNAKSKIQNSQPSVPNFEQVLRTCGALSDESTSFVLSEDQAVLSMKVNKYLEGSNDKIKSFLDSINENLSKPNMLQKLLTHTLTSDDCEVARGPVQDSMIRILLHVHCLQIPMIKLLIEKLGDIVLNEDETECSQLVSSILRQLRFLSMEKNVELADQLFEIIDVAPINVQREMIFMLPEIIPHTETELVSLKLVNMLKEESSLTNVVVDALTNLSLNRTVMLEVREKVVSRLDKCPTEFLPSLVQFILSKCEDDEYTQVINSLRENLPFTVQHQNMRKEKKPKEDDTHTKMTFDILKYSAMASKQMVDAWLKIISTTNVSADFRCLDLMMLVILHGNVHGRKSQIMSLIRNKIKSLVITKLQVVNLFKALTVVVSEYFSSVLEIASSLVKSVYSTIADIGAIFYEECFVNFNYFMEQCVMNELLVLVATGSTATIDVVFSILKRICDKHKETLCGHTQSIMSLLNKVLDLEVTQLRVLMNVISDLIFFAANESRHKWQDELQIFIRKQVISPKLELSKKGIIAAVTFCKYAGKQEIDDSRVQINNLLIVAMGSPGSCDVRRTFFNDEFSRMFRESQLSPSFLTFWEEKIHRTFVTHLFVKNIDIECEHFSMSLQYSACPENQNQTVLPVVGFVNGAHSDETLDLPLTVIPSALKLLWCCDKTFDSNLFSSSVIMPEVTVVDNFQDLDDNPKTIVMHCLFLCINYLIECVNAYSVHNDVNKALIRLRQVLLVRKDISRHIRHVPSDYLPPGCQFHCPVQKILLNKPEKPTKKGRKRKADDSPSRAEEPAASGQTPAVNAGSIRPSETEENLDPAVAYRGYFRQLHVDCFNLLKVDLISVDDVSPYENQQDWQIFSKLEIDTEDALFLLEDGINKCEQLLRQPKVNFSIKGKQNYAAADEINATQFVEKILKILPNLVQKMEIWSAYCKKLIRENEGIYDGPGMFSKESRPFKVALVNSLKFVAEIISWPGFREPTNKFLLGDVLSILSKKKNTGERETGGAFVTEKVSQTTRYLASFSKSVLLLSGGLSIVKAILACFSFSQNSSREILGNLCLEMLQRPWFTATGQPEKGTVYNQQLDFLLNTYFSAVENPLETVHKTAITVLDEMGNLTDKTSSLNSFKSVQRINLPILYRGMCDALVSASTEKLAKCETNAMRLLHWNAIVETMLILVNIVKVQSSRVNLAILLKRSQSIIQLFFTSGMTAVELALRSNSVEMLKLLKSLQTVTRFLHSVCCHSKVTNDSLVAAHVPAIRAQCERLTLEVKGMLISNKIPMECITIAILKNKDLEGNDILSQQTMEDDSEENSELLTEERDEYSDNEDGEDSPS